MGLELKQKPPEPLPGSFIVEFWANVFHALRWISPFSWLCRTVPWLAHPTRWTVLVEIWVVCHMLLAAAAALSSFYIGDTAVIRIWIAYGGLRVFEVIVYQANVLLFDEWRAAREGQAYSLRSYRRMVILLIHNYVEIILWFMAVLIWLYHAMHVEITSPTAFTMFSTSLSLMTGFSAAAASPVTMFAALILAIQALVGLFMTLVTLARFVSLLPIPRTLDPHESVSK